MYNTISILGVLWELRMLFMTFFGHNHTYLGVLLFGIIYTIYISSKIMTLENSRHFFHIFTLPTTFPINIVNSCFVYNWSASMPSLKTKISSLLIIWYTFCFILEFWNIYTDRFFWSCHSNQDSDTCLSNPFIYS